MDFFVNFKLENEGFHQDYKPLEDGKILQYAVTLHKKKRLDRWAIYPNMKRDEKTLDRVYGIPQHSREDVMKQHRAEAKVCLLDGIKQYISIFYTDANVPDGYSENMVVVYYDYMKNSETLFIIPIKGKKLKMKKMDKLIKTSDFSPCNITGLEIEKYGDYQSAVNEWNEMIEMVCQGA
jgi:hypothetical protein